MSNTTSMQLASSSPKQGWGINPRLLSVGAFIVLALLPIAAKGFWLYSLAMVLSYAVCIMAVSTLYRFTGEISIGHTFFMAIGAYSVAIMQTTYNMPILLGMLVGIVASVMMGVIFAWPSRSLSGVYLSVATMALGLCVPELLLYGAKVTGGFEGLYLDSEIINGVSSTHQQYYLALFALTIASIVAYRFRYSRIGLAVLVARDHPHAASAFGMKTARARLSVFALSAGLAGLGGGSLAFTTSMVSPNSFGFNNAITLLVGAVVSLYSTRIYGAFLGGVFITILPQLLSEYGSLISIIYGAALVGVILLSNVYLPKLMQRFKRGRA